MMKELSSEFYLSYGVASVSGEVVLGYSWLEGLAQQLTEGRLGFEAPGHGELVSRTELCGAPGEAERQRSPLGEDGLTPRHSQQAGQLGPRLTASPEHDLA